MAYRKDDPYNQGIGNLDLSQYGLVQPEENMTVAENLNINSLKNDPNFQETFVPREPTGGLLDAIYNAEYNQIPKGISKYDFLKGINDGTFSTGGGGVFEENVGDLFPKGTFKGDWNTLGDADINLEQIPGSYQYNIDVDTPNIQGDVLKDLQKKGWFNTPKDQASLVNEYGYPKMASLSGAVPKRASAIDQMANYDWSNFDTNIAKNNALANQMNTTLDNTLMGPAKRDFTNVGGLGIANEPGVEQEEYLETPSKFQNFKSKMGDMMSGIGGMFKKLPTPMNLLTGMFKESPEQRAMMDLYNSGEYQDVLGQIPGAENLNPVYGMGAGYGLSGALGKRLAMRNSQKTQDRISKLSQQRRDKFAAQSAAIEQAISLEKAKIGARIGASGKIPTSGGGGTPDQGGTYGGYSYGGEGQQAGRQGYGYGLRDGGLATLFARRG